MSDTECKSLEKAECPPVDPSDREIIIGLLFPLFQNAQLQNRNLSRTVLRGALAKYFFPWIHVSEVLAELEDKNYVSLLTTRGGGIFMVGKSFHIWQEEMRADEEPAGPDPKSQGSTLKLDAAEVRQLAVFIKSLAALNPSEKGPAKVRLAAVEAADEADFITRLIKS